MNEAHFNVKELSPEALSEMGAYRYAVMSVNDDYVLARCHHRHDAEALSKLLKRHVEVPPS